jgi:hypothetical protein
MTNLSTTTEQMIKEAIEAEMEKMQAESAKAAALIEARFQKIDDPLQLLATQLVRDIFSQLTGANSPFVTASQLSKQIEQLSNGPPPCSLGSPTWKQAQTTGPGIHSGTEHPMDACRRRFPRMLIKPH